MVIGYILHQEGKTKDFWRPTDINHGTKAVLESPEYGGSKKSN